jgi:RNA polymerase II subunit A-like phosphatase
MQILYCRALFPCGDKMVCIIDDREDVWNFAQNLIHVKPYRFFQGTADINAPPGLTKNEHDSEPVHHQVRRVSRSHSVDKEKEGEEVKVDDKEIKGDNSKSVMEGESDKSELNVVSGDIETENKDDIKQNAKQDESENIFVDKLNEMKTEHSVDNGTKKLSGSHSDSENNNQNVRDQIDSVIEKTECVDQSELEINNDMNQSEKKEESDNVNSTSKYADDTNSEEVDKNKITSTIEINNDMNQSEKKEESDNVNSMSKYADDTNSEEVDTNKITSTIETKSKETDDDVGSRENMEETGMEIDNKTPDEIDKTEDESSLSLTKETKIRESDGANSDDAINEEANIDNLADDDIEIEWDDEDDYLLYLEEILTRIYKTFFDFNDELKSKKEKNEIPDLKDIISYIKRKVLKGVNVVFSGVFPTNIVPEKSRAFIVAKALGANVHTNIIPKSDVEKGLSTTHLVAAKLGTNKVRMAQKVKGIKIVNPNWLWSCAERYEHVDERLFPLDKESYKMENCDSPDVTKDKNRKRKSDPEEVSDESNSGKRLRKSDGESAQILVDDNSNEASTSVQTAENENPVFVSTFNPLLAFSDDDLACMDKEVEEIMDEDQDNNSSEDEVERDSRMRSFVLSENASSSEDSLSGDLPRGWKRKDSGSSESPGSSEHGRNNDIENIESENDLEKFENTVNAFAPDSESDNESIGSMDDEMAAAIEKEFLEL